MTTTIAAPSIVFGGHARFLSPFYLDLARRSFHRCAMSKKKPATGYLEGFILVAVSLEAFINEVCLEKIDRRKEASKSTKYLEAVMSVSSGRDRNIRDKWRRLPRQLWQGKRFDERTRLWRDFNTLIELRNMLVHYKSEYREEGYVPEVIKPVLNRLRAPSVKKSPGLGLLQSLVGNSRHWTELICCPEMGSWALNTGVGMVSRFLEFASTEDDVRNDYISMLSRIRLIP